ncbi:MAG: hypothetical protein KDK60_01180, partial [Chlamydiia bacterium]|nr:hypothetical protein [Chlamydiia bacterium]
MGTSPLFQVQVLSLTGNLLYFTLWLHGKGWMKLASKSVFRLRGIYYISQIILYERSVTIAVRALYQYQCLRRNHPALYSEKEEVAHLKEQSFVHSITFFQALMQGLSHYFGVPYPRRYHTLLQATRISLGLFAIRSERDIPKKTQNLVFSCVSITIFD